MTPQNDRRTERASGRDHATSIGMSLLFEPETASASNPSVSQEGEGRVEDTKASSKGDVGAVGLDLKSGLWSWYAPDMGWRKPESLGLSDRAEADAETETATGVRGGCASELGSWAVANGVHAVAVWKDSSSRSRRDGLSPPLNPEPKAERSGTQRRESSLLRRRSVRFSPRAVRRSAMLNEDQRVSRGVALAISGEVSAPAPLCEAQGQKPRVPGCCCEMLRAMVSPPSLAKAQLLVLSCASLPEGCIGLRSSLRSENEVRSEREVMCGWTSRWERASWFPAVFAESSSAGSSSESVAIASSSKNWAFGKPLVFGRGVGCGPSISGNACERVERNDGWQVKAGGGTRATLLLRRCISARNCINSGVDFERVEEARRRCWKWIISARSSVLLYRSTGRERLGIACEAKLSSAARALSQVSIRPSAISASAHFSRS